MESEKYSIKFKGSIKHINHPDGERTLCGLELENMSGITKYETNKISLKTCDKCRNISNIAKGWTF